MENNQVTFRRIHGRIVPIKIKTDAQRKRRNFGIGAVVAGGISSAGATKLSYFTQVKGQELMSMAGAARARAKWVARKPIMYATIDPLMHWAVKERAAKRFLKIAKIAGRKGRLLKRIAPHIKTAGIWIGASLIGSGLARIFEDKNEPNLKGTMKELGFTAATAAALYGSGDMAVTVKAGRALAKILSRGKIK